MEYNWLFYVIIVFLLFDYVVDAYLNMRNRMASRKPVPNIVADVYDAEKYRKQQMYFAENDKFGSVCGGISLVVMLLMFFFYGFGFVDSWIRSFGFESETLISVVFVAVLLVAQSILDLPFDAYKSFVIEEKYGFNRMTKKTFIADAVKGILLTGIISCVLVAALCGVWHWLGESFWIVGWIICALFSIFMVMFNSTIIVPLFNKQTPLEEGELRTAIESFCKKAGYTLDNIFVIDGSKRSSKANAYFSGLGYKKRICLYDTLIETMTTEEIVAVLSHEIGHYQKGHIQKLLCISILHTGAMLFLLSLMIGDPQSPNALGIDLAEAMGTSAPSFHIGMIVFAILFAPISRLIGIISNTFSRKCEYEADAFAREHGMAEHLVTSLKKLSRDQLSNLTPDSWYVFCHYNHPSLVERINALKKEII